MPQSTYTGAVNGRALKHAITPHRSRNGQVWERVARAATNATSVPGAVGPSSQRLPSSALPSTVASASSSTRQPPFRQAQRSTPWASSSAQPAPTAQRSASQATARSTGPAPRLSASAFPSLPKAPTRDKLPLSGNQSLRKYFCKGCVFHPRCALVSV